MEEKKTIEQLLKEKEEMRKQWGGFEELHALPELPKDNTLDPYLYTQLLKTANDHHSFLFGLFMKQFSALENRVKMLEEDVEDLKDE